MKIDFEYEISELTADLKAADGYLECERVIINNIRKHVQNGLSNTVIENFLEKLGNYFHNKTQSNLSTVESVNYKYAKGFIDTLHIIPYWRSWILAVKQ